jgi:hypothetical protein
MYTKEYDPAAGRDGMWEILDPDGDWICHIPNEMQAEALLSHLNRNS